MVLNYIFAKIASKMQKLLCIESFLIVLGVRVLCSELAGRLPTVSRLNINREQGRLDSQSVSQSVNINSTTPHCHSSQYNHPVLPL